MTRPYAAAAPKDVMAVTGRTIDKWTEAKNEKRYDAQPRVLAEEAAVMVEKAATAIKTIKPAPANASRVASRVNDPGAVERGTNTEAPGWIAPIGPALRFAVLQLSGFRANRPLCDCRHIALSDRSLRSHH
jgi:hypothetical protein